MLTLTDIVKKFPETVVAGNAAAHILKVEKLENVDSAQGLISWCNAKNISKLKDIKQGTIICSEEARPYFNAKCNYLISANPRKLFADVVKEFFYTRKYSNFVAESASIHPSVTVPDGVYIGRNVVIHAGCKLAKGIIIMDNTVLYEDTEVGADSKIGANCTIGGDGFGYEKNSDGDNELIPHIGNVKIGNRVEIGNNTCIDRAVLGSTFIKDNAKIDNLVHIAHGVEIGENTLVIAHAMIGGSTVIGRDVWVGPGAQVLNKITVADDAFIGMGAIVTKPVEKNWVVAGCPAKFLRFNK